VGKFLYESPSSPSKWPCRRRISRIGPADVGVSYSIDGSSFTSLGAEPFQIDPGRWVGATVGLFSSAPSGTQAYVGTSVGYADFDYFHVRRHKALTPESALKER
jgi:hypothetical protein